MRLSMRQANPTVLARMIKSGSIRVTRASGKSSPALINRLRRSTARSLTDHDNRSDWQSFAKWSIDYLRRIGG